MSLQGQGNFSRSYDIAVGDHYVGDYANISSFCYAGTSSEYDIQAKIVSQGLWIKVKVTGTKTGFTNVTNYTHSRVVRLWLKSKLVTECFLQATREKSEAIWPAGRLVRRASIKRQSYVFVGLDGQKITLGTVTLWQSNIHSRSSYWCLASGYRFQKQVFLMKWLLLATSRSTHYRPFHRRSSYPVPSHVTGAKSCLENN